MEKPNLNKEQKLIVDSFRKPKNKQELANFIEDLFTSEEILDLAQRLKIAKLILDGKTYEEIAAEIPVSTSTISKIGQIIKFGKGGFSLLHQSTKAKQKSTESTTGGGVNNES